MNTVVSQNDSMADPSFLGMANTLADNATTGQWLKLADYGDWPHPAGLQRLTPTAAATMVRGFQSLWGRLRRRFGGVPIYVGHPDDPAFAGQAGHEDSRAYAWITALEAREDGLYILPRWSESGREILRQAFYKFLSPRWQMHPLGDGTFEPVRLLSVGLTNHPNIPGEAIANARPQHTPQVEGDWKAQLLAVLELEPGTSSQILLAKIEQLASAANVASTAQAEAERFYRLATDADTARQGAETRAEAERSARIDLLLDLAEWRGSIAPTARDNWRQQLVANFAEASVALANEGRVQNNATFVRKHGTSGTTTALTAHLATRRPGAIRQADSERLLSLVNERMTRTGEDYATAFARTKRDHIDSLPG